MVRRISYGKNGYVDAKADKTVIDILAQRLGVDYDDDILRPFVDYMVPFVVRFEHESGKPFGRRSPPNSVSLWYGLMMIVSLAMMTVEDDTATSITEVIPLLYAFNEDEDYGAHWHGMAWLLYVTFEDAVSFCFVCGLLLLVRPILFPVCFSKLSSYTVFIVL